MNNLGDSLNMKDSMGGLHGFVIIKDQNGKILVQAHNMIVNTGHQMVKDKFFNYLSESKNNGISTYTIESKFGNVGTYRNYNIKKIFFSTDTEQTSFTDELTKKREGYKKKEDGTDTETPNKIIDKGSFSTNGTSFIEYTINTNDVVFSKDDSNEYYIKITKEISIDNDVLSCFADNVKLINSLGIVAGPDSGSGDEILFSRITFDAIPLQVGNTFTISYYIYF